MNRTPTIYALIVAAGTGTRAGGAWPKQYVPIGGKPLLAYSAQALSTHPAIAGVQVVIHPQHEAYYAKAMPQANSLPFSGRAGVGPFEASALDNGPLLASPLRVEGYAVSSPLPKLLPPVIGGAQRSDSVRAGLAALSPYQPDYVLIHDAARPFLSHAMIDQLVAALAPNHAVMPALAVADTVRRFDGAWHEVSRDGLLRVQTPQAFPFAELKKICVPDAATTDEAALWLAAGHSLSYVAGDEELRKVTTTADIEWAEKNARLTRRVAVGQGFDVHALMPSGEKKIRLGGIDIDHSHQLHGHSDADVVLHAVVDALLGAVGAGDIGSHFPPSDARWKGADSAIFVEEARRVVTAQGGVISHVDVTIIAERPHISPHREAMREVIARLLHVPVNRISVKATTTEKLGFTGREEGIACQAVATITLPEGA